MINKLRRKFVLINMILVTIVLLIVFGTLVIYSMQKSASESREVLSDALRFDMDEMPKIEIGRHSPPPDQFMNRSVFVVLIDDSGLVVDSYLENVEISDEDLDSAVSEILSKNKTEGILSAFDLRYLLEKTPMGTKIAFLDYRSEQNDFSKLILSSLLVGTGGLAAFFVISIFLSRWALYPVQKTWKQQQQFVSDASHELKTPLTVILADTDIVLSHPKDSVHDQSKWLEDVRYEAQRMKKLIESMLFLAKSDEISAKRKKSEFSMSDAVWSSLLSFESIAFEKGIAMKNDILPDISIIGNEDEIRRLIDVLLDNAMKYTEPGGKVTTSLDRQGDKVRLCVHNTGKEIAREHLGNLFRRFYRADESRSGVSEGFGLGLSIASSIADRHNAKLSVESASGSGTCFSVLFQTPPRSTAKHP